MFALPLARVTRPEWQQWLRWRHWAAGSPGLVPLFSALQTAPGPPARARCNAQHRAARQAVRGQADVDQM
jgi:hypothetical protein